MMNNYNLVKEFEIAKLFNHIFSDCPKNILHISTDNNIDINVNKLINNCAHWNYDLTTYYNNSISKSNFYYYLIISMQAKFNKMTIKNVIKKEIQNGIFDPLMKIIILLNLVHNRIDKMDFIDVFEFCWKMHFVNVTIICYGNNVQIFTYNPFLKMIQSKLIKSYIQNSDENMLKNLHKYPLRSEAIYDKPLYVPITIGDKKITTGISNFFAEALFVHLNATNEHIVLQGRYYVNLSSNLVNNISDICINWKAIGNNVFNGTEHMYPILVNDLCIVTPQLFSGLILQRMQNMITPQIFGLFLSTVLGTILIWYGQDKFNYSDLTIVDQLFKTLALITNVSYPIKKQLRISEKILWASWFFFCIVSTTMFNAVFFRVMMLPRQQVDLNTAESISDNGIILLNYLVNIYVEIYASINILPAAVCRKINRTVSH